MVGYTDYGTRPVDLWFYDKSGLGWIWTNAASYPYFYSNSARDGFGSNEASVERGVLSL